MSLGVSFGAGSVMYNKRDGFKNALSYVMSKRAVPTSSSRLGHAQHERLWTARHVAGVKSALSLGLKMDAPTVRQLALVSKLTVQTPCLVSHSRRRRTKKSFLFRRLRAFYAENLKTRLKDLVSTIRNTGASKEPRTLLIKKILYPIFIDTTANARWPLTQNFPIRKRTKDNKRQAQLMDLLGKADRFSQVFR